MAKHKPGKSAHKHTKTGKNMISLKCLKCGTPMHVQDTKSYKSYKDNKDVKNSEYNTYIHRWRKCNFCGSLLQTAELPIEGTFVENNYEDFMLNLEFYKGQSKTK